MFEFVLMFKMFLAGTGKMLNSELTKLSFDKVEPSTISIL